MTSYRLVDGYDPKFWNSLDRSGGEDSCWLHKVVARNRYGKVERGYKHYRAHRWAYLLTYGSIPDGLQIHHSCDVPACCNPKHLWAGTQKENMQDKVKKGRANVGDKRGEACANKLTLKEVHEIREKITNGMRMVDIAKQYPQVKYQAITHIKYGKTWRGL